MKCLYSELDSFIIDDGTNGQAVYEDGGIEGEDDENMVDDSVRSFVEHTDSVYCISK